MCVIFNWRREIEVIPHAALILFLSNLFMLFQQHPDDLFLFFFNFPYYSKIKFFFSDAVSSSPNPFNLESSLKHRLNTV